MVKQTSTITAQVTALESLRHVLLDYDGATGGVDQPAALLHLADELFVEEALGLLVERAVDGDNIALAEHLLEGIDAPASNLLLDLGLQCLVIVVEELLAVKGLQPPEHSLSDAADSDSSDDLVLEIIGVFGNSGNIPFTASNLFMCGDKVADEGENGHDDMLGDRHDVAAGNFGNSNTAVGLVGGIEVDVVATNSGSDGKLELLCAGKTLSGQVAGMETIV